MKTSIETINGELYTVIWPDKLWDKRDSFWADSGLGYNLYYKNQRIDSPIIDIELIATALPALPNRPKPEDAALLYRYASEGVFARGATKSWVDGERGGYWTRDNDSWLLGVDAAYIYEITHAVDADGNRVEVAIEGE